MAEIEILPQKIVDIRTVILKSRLDSNMVKFQGGRLKTSFFSRCGFLKPRSNDILLVAFSKYYEPYIVIGGKYSIDYCKRHDYALKVEDRTQAIFIDGKKMKPEPLSLRNGAKVIKLVGEEHSHYENETYVILDRFLQEIPPENLVFAPSESEHENQSDVDFDLRKPRISLEEEITFLRSKIARRPSDVAEIIREIFEINERIIVYSPVYELSYKNLKNGKTVTTLINGVTGRITLVKFDKALRKVGEYSEFSLSPETLQTRQMRFFRSEPEKQLICDEAYISNSSQSTSESLIVEEKVGNAQPSLLRQESNFQLSAENTTHVATDFMARLGYKQNQFPTKLYVDGETNVVELQLQQGTARVQIDAKTKEVKEYEIQEAEGQEGFFTLKRKALLFLSSIVAIVAVALKLINFF